MAMDALPERASKPDCASGIIIVITASRFQRMNPLPFSRRCVSDAGGAPSRDHAFAHGVHGVTRRTAIQAGAIGLLGLGINHVTALRSLAAAGGPPLTRGGRAKSVIYIFLSGGLSQHEIDSKRPILASSLHDIASLHVEIQRL